MEMKRLDKKKRWLVGALMIVMTVLFAACGTAEENNAEEDTLKIVTSFYPLYDFASKIGGAHVQVESLVATGVEPHDWTPKPLDLAKVNEADVFIYNGWGFEGWVEDFLDGVDDTSQLVIVEAVQNIEPIKYTDEHEHDGEEEASHEDEHEHDGEEEASHEDEHEHNHGEYDPHVWISPLQAIQVASNIKDGLVKADPEHAEDYEANYATLVEQLDELHQEFVAVVEEGTRNEIVVSHHAYGYLARDYGLEQIAITGISPDAEPTAQDMKQIIDFIQTYDVKYILFEELASPKLAEMLAEDTGTETLVFNPVEGLTDEQAEQGEDYFSLMKKNLDNLQKALQ